MTLSDFLRQYRKLSATEESAKLQRLFMLVELEPMTVIWQVGRHTSWNELLRAEQLGPVAYFHSFKDATDLYKKSVLERIGADAGVALTRIEPHLRDLTMKRIDQYIANHGRKPHIMMVYAIVRALRKTVVVRPGKGKMMYATQH